MARTLDNYSRYEDSLEAEAFISLYDANQMGTAAGRPIEGGLLNYTVAFDPVLLADSAFQEGLSVETYSGLRSELNSILAYGSRKIEAFLENTNCVASVVLPVLNDLQYTTIPEEEIVSNAVSAEVLVEIEKEGLKNAVYHALSLAEETYSSLESLRISTKYDPEISGLRNFEIELTVSGEPEKVLDEEIKYRTVLASRLDKRAMELIALTYIWKS